MKPFTERRKRIAKALPLRDEILLIGAGEPVPLPEASDQTYPFRAHSEYYYLTGIDRPGGVLAFDPKAALFEKLGFFCAGLDCGR
jgi:Xaa-Pro aminopeptidase